MKHGGKRKGAGRKSGYGEKTENISMRVPTSKIPEVKKMVKRKLKTYKKKPHE